MKRPAPLPRPERPSPHGGSEGVPAQPIDEIMIGPPRVTSRRPAQEATVRDLPEEPREIVEPDPGVERAADEVGSEPAVGRLDVWRARRAHRRALRSEVKRFTVRQRRRRYAWFGGIVAVVLVAGVSAVAAYSPLFAVEKVTIAGAKKLDVDAVEADLEAIAGTPISLVDAEAVQKILAEYPLIESYSLEARPPHDIVVRVVERTPVGVVKKGQRFQTVDAAGVVLASSSSAPKDQPVLEARGGTESSAFSSIARVVRALPGELRKNVVRVTATTPNDVTLVLRDGGAEVVWGDAEQSAKKAATLTRLMAVDAPAKTRRYDVSSPGVATVVRR